MDMLQNKRINVNQFLDQVLYIIKSIGSLANDIEQVAIDESRTDPNNESLEQQEEEFDDPTTDTLPKGTCISCLSKICDIILLPCFHIVVCSKCWKDKRLKHERDCDAIYRSNKKKLSAERKKVPCPACNQTVVEAKVFEMASVQF